MAIKPGAVFWPLPTDDVPRPHPWIVISSVAGGKVLTVNITDEENCIGSPCVLEIGEHESVTKRSVIFYRLFRERDAVALEKALVKKIGINHCADVSPALLARIVAGMKASGDVRNAIKVKYGFMAAKKQPESPF